MMSNFLIYWELMRVKFMKDLQYSDDNTVIIQLIILLVLILVSSHLSFLLFDLYYFKNCG